MSDPYEFNSRLLAMFGIDSGNVESYVLTVDERQFPILVVQYIVDGAALDGAEGTAISRRYRIVPVDDESATIEGGVVAQPG